MAEHNQTSKPEAPKPPDLIPEPGGLPGNNDNPGYKPAATDIENEEHLKLVENFIGSIYGEAKQIDKSNLSNSEYTKGLKFNAEQEIINARKDLHSRTVGSIVQMPNSQQPNAQMQPIEVPQHQNVKARPAATNTTVPTSTERPAVSVTDSLILKHEIDLMKEQIKDIKKLYDEFFKLKQVKGHWQIKSKNKVQKATSISKTWNIINKLLKNKSDSIIIEYNDSDE